MRRIGVYALLLFGVFYFSEGKPCPEKTRPHKTRCDVYYKCQDLPTQTHVWVPTRCEEGLIYERHLKLCVLPEDDWECYSEEADAPAPGPVQEPEASTPGAAVKTKDSSDVVIVRADRGAEVASLRTDDNSVQLVADGSLSSEEEDDDDDDDEEQTAVQDDEDEGGEEEEEEEDSDGSDYESSGNGEAMTQENGMLLAETKEGGDLVIETEQKEAKAPPQQETEAEGETEPDSTPSRIDPKLTAHLQRLSQLIDGLKQTYQSTDTKQTDMRPDQLNAFLAHFNINNKFNNLNPDEDYKPPALSSTTPPPQSTTARSQRLPTSSKNKTALQEHLSSNKMKPETKVDLSSSLPKRYGTGNGGYSNSQIVVNHPEGSVLFSLPPYGSDGHFGDHSQDHYGSHHSPKISEDTLKTVLELSKQMISTQNVPKVIPNPAFYPQPILQPLFLSTAAFGGSPASPFSSYLNSNSNNNNNNGDYDDNDYGQRFPSPTPTNYYKPQGQHQHQHHGHKKQRPGGGYAKPGTTIIHNNVIPVHLTSSGSGEKEHVDSYGQSLGIYPPLGAGDNGNSYQVSTSSSSSSNHLIQHQQQSHRFENNKFVASITTVRPSLSTTPANHYSGQYPSPYPTEISVTTMRPFEFHPSPSTVAEFYTPSPHLNDNNVNDLYRPSDRYPTVHYSNNNNNNNNYNNLPRPIDPNRQQSIYQQMERPSQHQQQQQQQYYSGSKGNLNSLFPTIDSNKVKIRPNSQKVESMEDVSEEIVSYDEQRPVVSSNHNQLVNSYNNNYNNNNYNNNNYNNNNKIGHANVQQQLAQSQYVDQISVLSSSSSSSSSSSNNNNNPKHPYMPRPTPSASFGATISIASSNNNNNKPKFPTYGSNSHEGAQLVNVGGNFIRYDVFQNTILPLLGHSPNNDDLNNVEVITCVPGIRQPNVTDCTRYYVCSKKDGKVLSYSCPPYTAFNAQTRICDAYSYSVCTPSGIASSYTVTENKRLQLEALQVLQEAKRRREQAIKAQNIANLLQQYGGGGQVSGPSGFESESGGSSSQEKDMLNTYVQQAASLASTVVVSSTPKPAKKRKYYCKEGDKIPDQTSIYSYFVCYKNSQGQMKGHKMTCSKGLLFCPKSSMCTLASKCS